MANREQRGNREKRKPKVKKLKTPAAQVSSFARAPGGNPKGSAGKKVR